jgi:hypothetical protein
VPSEARRGIRILRECSKKADSSGNCALGMTAFGILAADCEAATYNGRRIERHSHFGLRVTDAPSCFSTGKIVRPRRGFGGQAYASLT